MLLIPAIDLKDGHCVRLKQGAMDDATVFSEHPAAMARHWIDQGARRLHLVDLNGAFAGKPKNEPAIKAILNNKPLRYVLLSDLVAGVSGGIVATLFIYMVSFGLDLPKAASWLLIVYFLMGAIAIPPMIWLSKKLGKHQTFVLSCVINAILLPCFFLLPKGEIVPAMILFTLLGLNMSTGPFLFRAIMADVADHDHAETGEARAGVYFSLLALTNKLGYSCAIFVSYAVLAYMAQAAVQSFGWLQPGEMADGLGLAETTPGPLIMVTQFVGFLAAFRAPEPFSPLMAGLVGAALTTWVTFAPCFLWIFACAPWIDHLRHATRLKGGLAAITATVVGVIGNLSVWFALHVLFRRVDMIDVGFARFSAPIWSSFDVVAAGLAALAFFLMFVARWKIVRTLGLCAGAGLLASLL